MRITGQYAYRCEYKRSHTPKIVELLLPSPNWRFILQIELSKMTIRAPKLLIHTLIWFLLTEPHHHQVAFSLSLENPRFLLVKKKTDSSYRYRLGGRNRGNIIYPAAISILLGYGYHWSYSHLSTGRLWFPKESPTFNLQLSSRLDFLHRICYISPSSLGFTSFF